MHTIFFVLSISGYFSPSYYSLVDNKDRFQEIPKEFYSFETNSPFERCIECDVDLIANNLDYVIEIAKKSYKGFSAEDTVFDYAMCINCAMKMRNEFSVESLKNMENYFSNIKMQQELNTSNELLIIDDCLAQCAIKDIQKDEVEEYQIYAYCTGDKLNKTIPPYMISGQAIDEVLPLLSNATTEFLNGFFDKHFSPDPSLMEPTPKDRLVFI
ncbi:MAG: hypothetical protein JXQ90_14220 [Cyclobacteriaceae bacterium]